MEIFFLSENPQFKTRFFRGLFEFAGIVRLKLNNWFRIWKPSRNVILSTLNAYMIVVLTFNSTAKSSLRKIFLHKSEGQPFFHEQTKSKHLVLLSEKVMATLRRCSFKKFLEARDMHASLSCLRFRFLPSRMAIRFSPSQIQLYLSSLICHQDHSWERTSLLRRLINILNL